MKGQPWSPERKARFAASIALRKSKKLKRLKTKVSGKTQHIGTAANGHTPSGEIPGTLAKEIVARTDAFFADIGRLVMKSVT